MTRKTFTASLVTNEGLTLFTEKAFAFNSAVRKTEDLARRYARANGDCLDGGTPEREADEDGNGYEYRRTWSNDQHLLTAFVSLAS